jgi:hypothetical protein
MAAVASSTVCGCIPSGRATGGAGGAPSAFAAKGVSTTPGIASDTWMSGQRAARSTRRLAVSAFSAALAAL